VTSSLPTSVVAEYTWNGSEWVWSEDSSVGAPEDDRDSEERSRQIDLDDVEKDLSKKKEEGKSLHSMDDGSGGGRDDDDDYPEEENGSGMSVTNEEENEQLQNRESYVPRREPGDVVPDGSEDIPIDGPNYPTTRSPNLSKNNREPPPMQRSPSASFFAQPGTLAAVVGGAVVGLLCAILCVMFVVYRMRKKDEGSYALDEPKRSPAVNSYSKPPSREFYA
jgi:hypothetical protein